MICLTEVFDLYVKNRGTLFENKINYKATSGILLHVQSRINAHAVNQSYSTLGAFLIQPVFPLGLVRVFALHYVLRWSGDAFCC